MPLISVIVTCYDIEEYLEQCLESVVNQTLQDMEIIVVDDGSTDGTKEIITKFEAADPRIQTIFFSENTVGGVGRAANAGLDAATGEFIGFVDGDDYLELDMFEKMCRAAVDDQSDLVMCKYLEVLEATGERREPAERRCWAGLEGAGLLRLDSPERVNQILGFIAVPWRKVYARALLEENGIRFPEVDYAWEDNPFHWCTVCSARSISFVDEVLCYHRIGRAGQTMVSRDARFVKVFGHFETIRDWLSQRGILARHEGALLSWALSQFEWVVRRLPRESGDALYDALRPVVLSVDEGLLESTLKARLGRTGAMIRFVRNGEKQQFLNLFERRFETEASGSHAIGVKLERGLAMFGLARENLRTYGFRNTLSKALMSFGAPPWLLSSKKAGKSQPLTDEQMLKFLAILQRDIDRKHSEVLGKLRDIEDDLKDRLPK